MAKEDVRRGFFKVGGTLEPDNPSYVRRPADEELLRRVLRGEYCNLLTARQRGKSSLMVRTAARLREQGIRTAEIDISGSPGTGVTADEWYLGLTRLIVQKLSLQVDEVSWWRAQGESTPVQRFTRFMQEVVLAEMGGDIVIFLDEIDTTLTLPFFTDDFFAAIRAMHNKRASNPEYKRLTFVLVGAARPADLIKDRKRTPYNIGRTVELEDFSFENGRVLLDGLTEVYPPAQSEAILKRVFHWTSGQPYLTQKICDEVVRQVDGRWSDGRIDRLVESLFFQEGQRRSETHLQWVDDYIHAQDCLEEMLEVYRRVLSGEEVKDEERSIEKSYLKLSGIVKATPEGYLTVRNHIYERVFNANWAGLPEKSHSEVSEPKKTKTLLAGIPWQRAGMLVLAAVMLTAGAMWAGGLLGRRDGTPTPQVSPSLTLTAVAVVSPSTTPTLAATTDTPALAPTSTETLQPSSTPTSMPSETGIPTPTTEPASTATPSPIPSPTATATATSTPAPTHTAAPTFTSTPAAPILEQAPELSEPESDARVRDQVRLKWFWPRGLEGTEKFELLLAFSDGSEDRTRLGTNNIDANPEAGRVRYEYSLGIVLQPHLWGFVDFVTGGLRWPLEPSAPIVTASGLLSSGATPP